MYKYPDTRKVHHLRRQIYVFTHVGAADKIAAVPTSVVAFAAHSRELRESLAPRFFYSSRFSGRRLIDAAHRSGTLPPRYFPDDRDATSVTSLGMARRGTAAQI